MREGDEGDKENNQCPILLYERLHFDKALLPRQRQSQYKCPMPNV
ncbi:hypothetical protein [Nostoc sp.]